MNNIAGIRKQIDPQDIIRILEQEIEFFKIEYIMKTVIRFVIQYKLMAIKSKKY